MRRRRPPPERDYSVAITSLATRKTSKANEGTGVPNPAHTNEPVRATVCAASDVHRPCILQCQETGHARGRSSPRIHIQTPRLDTCSWLQTNHDLLSMPFDDHIALEREQLYKRVDVVGIERAGIAPLSQSVTVDA